MSSGGKTIPGEAVRVGAGRVDVGVAVGVSVVGLGVGVRDAVGARRVGVRLCGSGVGKFPYGVQPARKIAANWKSSVGTTSLFIFYLFDKYL